MCTCKYCGKECGKNGLKSHERRCAENPNFTVEYFYCSFCKKACNGQQALHKHERHCKQNPECKPQAIPEKYKKQFSEAELTCSYCSKLCKNLNSLVQHKRLCKSNPDRALTTYEKTGISNLSNRGWSKGLSKVTDPRIANISKALSEGYSSGKIVPRNGFTQSDETKAKISAAALAGKFEEHFGRKHIFEYAGQTFISSYEVHVAESLDAAGVAWQKPKRFKYKTPEGVLHHYTPDLYLPEYNVYLDPKNDYLINNVNPKFGYSDKEKIRWVEVQNNIRVIILNKNQLDWDIIKTLI
jgi:hypothetical protein